MYEKIALHSVRAAGIADENPIALLLTVTAPIKIASFVLYQRSLNMTIGLLLNSRHRFEKARIQEWNQGSLFLTLGISLSGPRRALPKCGRFDRAIPEASARGRRIGLTRGSILEAEFIHGTLAIANDGTVTDTIFFDDRKIKLSVVLPPGTLGDYTSFDHQWIWSAYRKAQNRIEAAVKAKFPEPPAENCTITLEKPDLAAHQ